MCDRKTERGRRSACVEKIVTMRAAWSHDEELLIGRKRGRRMPRRTASHRRGDVAALGRRDAADGGGRAASPDA
jgi:hypothetical protein